MVGTAAPKKLAWNLKTRLENSLLVLVIILVFSIPAWAAPVSEPELFKQLLSDIHERLAHMQPADDRFPYPHHRAPIASATKSGAARLRRPTPRCVMPKESSSYISTRIRISNTMP